MLHEHREDSDHEPGHRTEHSGGLNATPGPTSYGAGGARPLHGPAAAEESHHARLQSIKATSAREKMVLLDRIEELSAALHQHSRQAAEHRQEVEHYHRVFGSLNDFATRQTAMREELVSLQENVRHWQRKESAAREEARRLNRLLDAIRRSHGHEVPDDRLADLEERLATAQLQRSSIIQQARDLDALMDSRRTAVAVGAAHHADDASTIAWQERGKQADLQRQMQQVESLIESLEHSIHSLRAEAGSSEWAATNAATRRCPACRHMQWSSPFCPQTGHQHLGYPERSGETGIRNTDDSSFDPEPIFKPPTKEEVDARVDGALRSGEWTRLVAMGTLEAAYRHEPTGRTVPDLAAHIVASYKAEHEARRAEWERGQRQKEVQRNAKTRPEALAALERNRQAAASQSKGSELRHAPRLDIAENVKQLVAKLESMTAENRKLRGLLAKAAKSGVVGWQPPDTGRPSASAVPDPEAAVPPPAQHSHAGATASSEGRVTEAAHFSLHDEDDVMVETKLTRLLAENEDLSRRCAGLVVDVCKRDARISELQAMVLRADQRSPAEETVAAQKEELATVRTKLVEHEHRATIAEAEVRHLRARFLPAAST